MVAVQISTGRAPFDAGPSRRSLTAIWRSGRARQCAGRAL